MPRSTARSPNSPCPFIFRFGSPTTRPVVFACHFTHCLVCDHKVRMFLVRWLGRWQECRRKTCEECDEILHLVEANKSHHRIALFPTRASQNSRTGKPRIWRYVLHARQTLDPLFLQVILDYAVQQNYVKTSKLFTEMYHHLQPVLRRRGACRRGDTKRNTKCTRWVRIGLSRANSEKLDFGTMFLFFVCISIHAHTYTHTLKITHTHTVGARASSATNFVLWQ